MIVKESNSYVAISSYEFLSILAFFLNIYIVYVLNKKNTSYHRYNNSEDK